MQGAVHRSPADMPLWVYPSRRAKRLSGDRKVPDSVYRPFREAAGIREKKGDSICLILPGYSRVVSASTVTTLRSQREQTVYLMQISVQDPDFWRERRHKNVMSKKEEHGRPVMLFLDVMRTFQSESAVGVITFYCLRLHYCLSLYFQKKSYSHQLNN